MNKNYVLVKDEALVFDEIHKMTTRINQKGLESVLEQENIVEEIQKRIADLENKIAKFGKLSSPKKERLKYAVISNIFVFGLFAIFALAFGKEGIQEILSVKCVRPSILVGVPVTYVGMGILTIVGNFLNQIMASALVMNLQDKIRDKNALESQLQYLKEREKEEIAKLEQMKQALASKPVVKTEVSIDKKLDLDKLKQFRDQLEQELDSINHENYKKSEQGKQKVLG